jgi:hypothetical protein
MRDGLLRLRAAAAAGFSAVLGLAPHAMHHIGPIAGTALLTGVAGTLLFAALGLVLMIPFLLRLRRRFGGWRAPTVALAVFAAMFALSSFVVGPLLSQHG